MPDFQQRPYSITIFVPDGDPDGLRFVEKSNWTGVGVVFNRMNYQEAVTRPEFDKTGAYVLASQSDESLLPRIYDGEADRVNLHPPSQRSLSVPDVWKVGSAGSGARHAPSDLRRSRIDDFALRHQHVNVLVHT